jgi:hypothetical protein
LGSISEKLLAVDLSDRSARVFNLETDQALFSIKNANYVFALPNEQFAVDFGGSPQIYDANTGQVTMTLSLADRKTEIFDLLLLSDVILATIDRLKNEILLWDLVSGQMVRTLVFDPSDRFQTNYIHLVGDGILAIGGSCSSSHSCMQFWDWKSDRLIKKLPLENYTSCFAFLKKSNYLAITTNKDRNATNNEKNKKRDHLIEILSLDF